MFEKTKELLYWYNRHVFAGARYEAEIKTKAALKELEQAEKKLGGKENGTGKFTN